eukprot:CAMPEP_0119035016 /NCGR_PEP_ID=MMETSP1177-20130426/2001_1 /TAXON_ID=2985 /ORGANISM="Ochromonas sp, Strain CCMP1899" /LENGTH=243 /DNA_ID=CAMNT_0006992877 /DNA_START=281 /DNA_END=1009 /DNA_ORIENTATION=+
MLLIIIITAAFFVLAHPFKFNLIARQYPSSMSLLNHNKDSENNVPSTSEIPKISNTKMNTKFASSLLSATASLVMATFVAKPAVAATKEGRYIDSTNGFSLLVEPGWSISKRTTPTATMVQFLAEEVLYTGSRFNEGGSASSLSVTRTQAVRLLKDFNVDWWFAPLNSMKDLGSPELIAGLLILQRQGEFVKRDSASALKSAKIDDNDVLTFDFETPIGSIYIRRTGVKAYFRKEDKKLMVIW